MRKFLIPALMAAATIAGAAPASAQAWRTQPAVQRQIQGEINQLQNQIGRAQQRGTISGREATGLRREAIALQRLYNGYDRNGLDRSEVARLQSRVDRLHQRLRLEKNDWNGRRF